MVSAAGDTGNGHNAPRPAGPYWEDPVYRYLSRRHRMVEAGADDVARILEHMKQLVNGTMADDVYRGLEAEARAARGRRRQERKRKGKRPPKRTATDEGASSVNVAELKRRIFSPNVSRENVIKALKALPPSERRATIAGLPPGLRRKLGEDLKGC